MVSGRSSTPTGGEWQLATLRGLARELLRRQAEAEAAGRDGTAAEEDAAMETQMAAEKAFLEYGARPGAPRELATVLRHARAVYERWMESEFACDDDDPLSVEWWRTSDALAVARKAPRARTGVRDADAARAMEVAVREHALAERAYDLRWRLHGGPRDLGLVFDEVMNEVLFALGLANAEKTYEPAGERWSKALHRMVAAADALRREPRGSGCVEELDEAAWALEEMLEDVSWHDEHRWLADRAVATRGAVGSLPSPAPLRAIDALGCALDPKRRRATGT